MWLTDPLAPDFNAIANFRKVNSAATRRVCREFVVLCRRLNLFSHALVAIDGSKFKSVSSRDRSFTAGKVTKRRKGLDESVARDVAELDRVDRDPTLVPEDRVCHLKCTLEKLGALGTHLCD